ncbi:MAG: tetratricopeptide repeat protein [Planctomycetota bacterium]|nr:tetratricopeptide repeat protein [Planctomycetota bacterium]
MSIGRLLVTSLVLSLVITGALHYTGVVKVMQNGTVTVEAPGEMGVSGQFAKAERLFLEFKYDEAAVAYEAVLSQSPDSEAVPQAMYRVAKCYEELGKSVKAVAAYEAFLQHNATHALAGKARDRIEYLRSMAMQ